MTESSVRAPEKIGVLRPAKGKEVTTLKKHLLRLGYMLTSLAALLVALGAPRKWPGH